MPWMTDLFYDPATANDPRGAFPTRSLHQLTLPGTHDAGCYVDHLITNYLARTQSQNIFDQLAGGIRYFDIRPCISGGHFWTYHGPYYGGQIDGAGGIFGQIAQYIQTLSLADRELIILNISHFHQFQDADHVNLIAAINGALGPYLVPQSQVAINAFNTAYQTLLTHPVTAAISSRVMVIYDGALDTDTENYIINNALPAGFFILYPKYGPVGGPGPNSVQLFDQYANKWFVRDHLGSTGMQGDQLAKLTARAGRPYIPPGAHPNWATAAAWPANAPGGVAGTLHLLSWTLTPQTRLDDPISAAQRESNPQLLAFFTEPGRWAGRWYNPLPGGDNQINIIYVDDYASTLHINPGSPWHGMAMPVAIAARMNMGPVGPENTW